MSGEPKAPVFQSAILSAMSDSHRLTWLTESYSAILEYRLQYRKIMVGRFLKANYDLQGLKEKDNELHLINAFILICDLIDFIFLNFPNDVRSCTDPTALILPTNN